LLAGRTNDHLIEITLTTVAAYGSFLLAEHFHLSGVLATLVAGLLTGNIGSLGSFTDKGREAVVSFWEFIAFIVNSLIFMLIGIRGAYQNFTNLLLALGLPPEIPEREAIVTVSFAVVSYSIFVQGLTIIPLLRKLKEIPEL